MQFGQVLSAIKVAPHGATKLAIGCKIPFDFIVKRFHVFDYERRFAAEITDGSLVQFCTSPKTDGYPELAEIEVTELESCFICDAYFLKTDTKTTCGECLGLDKKQKIDNGLKLFLTNTKSYKYSKGLSLSFIDEADPYGGLMIALVYENHPWYEGLQQLKVGEEYHVRAWVDMVLDNGNCFITLFDRMEIDSRRAEPL